jgi:histone H3/H4
MTVDGGNASLLAELIEAALPLADEAARKFVSWMDERRAIRKSARST